MEPFQKYGLKSAPDPDAAMEAEGTLDVGNKLIVDKVSKSVMVMDPVTSKLPDMLVGP